MKNSVQHFNTRQAIEAELESGEQLLWSGKPAQGIRFRTSDFYIIPFSLLFGGFAFFWEYSVVQYGAPLMFALFGLPFVLLALNFIFFRFYIDMKQRSKTFYGLSNKRIIIISGFFSKKVTSLSLSTLTKISLSEFSKGEGTISFGQPPPQYHFLSRIDGLWWPGVKQAVVPKFDLIVNAKKVYQQIFQAKS